MPRAEQGPRRVVASTRVLDAGSPRAGASPVTGPSCHPAVYFPSLSLFSVSVSLKYFSVSFYAYFLFSLSCGLITSLVSVWKLFFSYLRDEITETTDFILHVNRH